MFHNGTNLHPDQFRAQSVDWLSRYAIPRTSTGALPELESYVPAAGDVQPQC